MTEENQIALFKESELPQVVEQQDPILGMIERVCSNPDFDVSKMEKLIALRDADRAENARKSYFTAFSQMQPELPIIPKNKKVKFNQTEYDFADLAQVTKFLTPIAEKFGFCWQHTTKGDVLTTILMHKEGHSVSTERTLKIDKSGGKNEIQGEGSASSYCKRYNLLDLFGIATNEDNDGFGVSNYITREQAAWVNKTLDATQSDKAAFLKLFKADSVPNIAASKFKEVETALKGKLMKINKGESNAGN